MRFLILKLRIFEIRSFQLKFPRVRSRKMASDQDNLSVFAFVSSNATRRCQTAIATGRHDEKNSDFLLKTLRGGKEFCSWAKFRSQGPHDTLSLYCYAEFFVIAPSHPNRNRINKPCCKWIYHGITSLHYRANQAFLTMKTQNTEGSVILVQQQWMSNRIQTSNALKCEIDPPNLFTFVQSPYPLAYHNQNPTWELPPNE